MSEVEAVLTKDELQNLLNACESAVNAGATGLYDLGRLHLAGQHSAITRVGTEIFRYASHRWRTMEEAGKEYRRVVDGQIEYATPLDEALRAGVAIRGANRSGSNLDLAFIIKVANRLLELLPEE